MTSETASVDKLMAEEATKSRLLALPGERTLGMRDMIMIQISFSVATWMLLTGAYIGMSAPFWPALIISVFGTGFPLLYHTFLGKMVTRWGIDQSILARITWGPVGTIILLPCFLFLMYFVWTSIPVVMFGRTVTEAIKIMGSEGQWWADARLWGVVALICSSLVLWRSAAVLFWFFRFVTPTIVVVLIILTVRTIVVYGWGNLTHIIPEGFDPNHDMSYMIGSEVAIGLGFSWVFCYSIYGRLAKTEKVGYWGTWVGWGPAWGLLSAPAILAALAAGVTDPVYLLEGANKAWVVIYLVFLFGANIFSAVCTMYIVSLAARVLAPKIPWGLAVLLNAAVLVLVFWTGAYDQFNKFITLVGATFGPLGGIMVVDYWLKRYKVNLREAYTFGKKSAYWYWWGINPFAFIAFAVGAALDVWMYNPFTLAVAHPSVFHIAGAAIPSTLVASVVYYGLARTFLVPKRIGFPEVPTVRRTRKVSAASVPQVALAEGGTVEP
ncbi:MAG: NCS1 family nucleobase:cation symporter-1 [Thermoleophilia bacterium]